ncbi:hypothetical protein SPRG_16915 [Saprolegnia parasitica CBS 223.65]|uniref:Uncharacterized protein n=1 Tax=Saprolegnia parasitica (strain CBS 223.65) TaxID=695850 RepID=A0A067BTU5_SAPPC|nr:hypothetical protein SPRG_16915 [Saprolegnia parasitica CBS 223.65]KDO17681.1 hypothetical protein SPRG_16915 [Saprolegnia parasitica CBS 223.65]|eukprot:XP_012211607.1 hypothetical protein SPRG_16915 [Saprolegnia parasitica CBS 223.65]
MSNEKALYEAVLTASKDAAVDALRQIAQAPLLYKARVAYAVASPAALDAMADALADALVATGAFDVALVEFATTKRVAAKNEPSTTAYVNCIAKCTPYDACCIPIDVASGLVGMGADIFLSNTKDVSSANFEAPCAALVFWLKPHRAGIVGIDVVLPLLDAACLGLDSHRDCMLGAMAIFRPHTAYVAKYDMPPFHNAGGERQAGRPTAGFLTRFSAALLHLADLDLVVLCLRDVVSVTIDTELPEVATFVHACLTKHGWVALVAAVDGLIQRWCADGKTGAVLHLLSSLAGVTTDDAVCPPLQQMGVGEFVRASYAMAQRQRRTDILYTHGEDPALQTYCLTHIVLLDWYINELAPHRPDSYWYSERLPLVLAAHVDSFVHPGSNSFPNHLPPMTWLLGVPTAIVKALASQPALQVGTFVDTVLSVMCTVKANRKVIHDWEWTLFSGDTLCDLLLLADHVGRVDPTLLENCFSIWGVTALLGVASFLRKHPCPLAAPERAAIARCVMVLANTLPKNKTGCEAEVEQMYFTSPVHPTLEAMDLLMVTEPETFKSFFSTWYQALELCPRTNRLLFFPVLDKLHSMGYRAKIALLLEDSIKMCVNARPIDLAIRDVAMDATHCYECRLFDRFLRDSDKFSFPLHGDMCAQVEGVTSRHADELAHDLNRDARVIRKRCPTDRDEFWWINFMHTQQMAREDKAMAATLERYLADMGRPYRRRRPCRPSGRFARPSPSA